MEHASASSRWVCATSRARAFYEQLGWRTRAKPGAGITRAPGSTFWGGYSAMFTAPDGHAWEVAHNPHWKLHDDGSIELGD